MNPQKPKSIRNLEERMLDLDPASFRFRALEAAKSFKSSWIELGQYLFTVYQDKLYKDWGFLTFEAYCAKEIGIRQPTALKLLKSYSFLEKEEPVFLKERLSSERTPDRIPSYEAVNSLRLAKEKVSEDDYEELREEVLDQAREEGEVKKKIRYILKNTPSKDSGAEPEDQKTALSKRLVNGLRNAKNDMSALGFPVKIVKQTETLIELLSDFSGIKPG